MKQKTYQISFPVTCVVLILAFLSINLITDVKLSFAASGSKKSSAVVRGSAVDDSEFRIKQLESALKITEAQKELWNNLTQVMRENAKEMDALIKDRDKNVKTINAVEHLKLHSQFAEVHLDQLKKFIPPFEAFYASMSDKQKKGTDSIFRANRYKKH
jgi:hypothetical protein